MGRPRVGFYDLTGCQGCMLSVLYNEDEILDIVKLVEIVSFRFVKQEDDKGPLDIAFIEGTIVSKDDEERVKELRDRANVVVAIGACACEGNIPALRNFVDERELAHLKFDKMHEQQLDIGKPRPIHEFINVDFTLPGCPPDRDEIKSFLLQTLFGKKFRDYPDPVCIECWLHQNYCLLDADQICLGPITKGGCQAVCVNKGLICYGCRGLSQDAQLKTFFDLMEKKGVPNVEVKKVMETFMGIAINEKLRGTKWERLH